VHAVDSHIGFLGAGAHADEIAEYLPAGSIAFHAVDDAYLQPANPTLIPISTDDLSHIATPVIAAVGAPGLRRELVRRWHGTYYARVIANSAVVSPSASIGDGSVVMAGAICSTRVHVGSHVSINIGATVSHDAVLGDYSTLSPGVHVAGRCVIGEGVFLGVGAAVTDGVTIADGAVVGAGAVVIEDITEPGTYVGVPARFTRQRDGWLRNL